MSAFVYLCYLSGEGQTPRAVMTSRTAASEWLLTQATVFGNTKSRVVALRNKADMDEHAAVVKSVGSKIEAYRGCMKLYGATWLGRSILRKAVEGLLVKRLWHTAKVIAHVRLPEDGVNTARLQAEIMKLVKPVYVHRDFHLDFNAGQRHVVFMFLRSETELVAAKLAGVEIVRHRVLL